MKTIVIANTVGGCGKTCTAVALAAGLKKRGYRTLLVDLDHQPVATEFYGGRIVNRKVHFTGGKTDGVIQQTIYGDIIPGDMELLHIGNSMSMSKDALCLLKDALEPIGEDYDYIFIDTPAAPSSILANALVAADTVIIPVDGSIHKTYAMSLLSDLIEKIKEEVNPDLEIGGILGIAYEGDPAMDAVLAHYADRFDTQVYDTKIWNSVEVKSAWKELIPLYHIYPSCRAANEYEAFIDEFLEDM